MKKLIVINVLQKFFAKPFSVQLFVRPYNYTSTFSNYLKPTNNQIKTIHIHGELNNPNNPIIFGFAADDQESRNLIAKDDNEYMRNIKKHCYKRTANENRLIEYLKGIKDLDVLILGHSCGISDKLILNQIFNHENITSIRTFYYEQHENYFQTQVNIDRIMNDDANFQKLVNFSESHRMPQHSDTEKQQQEFTNYIEDLLKRQTGRKSKQAMAVRLR